MLKFSAVSQIWKKYIQKLNDWDLPLKSLLNALKRMVYLKFLFFNESENSQLRGKR